MFTVVGELLLTLWQATTAMELVDYPNRQSWIRATALGVGATPVSGMSHTPKVIFSYTTTIKYLGQSETQIHHVFHSYTTENVNPYES